MADDFMNGFLAGQGDNNRSGLFGGDGWWAIIIFALIFGWGNGGYGFGGGNSGGVADGYVLASDFANVERKIDAVNNGVCDGFYAMNTGMLNGFAGVTQAVTSGFSAAELARCNQQAALMQQLNAMQMQNQNCCCENRQAIAQVRYDMATDACAIKTAINEMGQQIMQNDNANYRALSDRLTQQEIDRLKSQLAEKDLLINQLNLGISQRNQTEDIVSQLKTTCGCNCN